MHVTFMFTGGGVNNLIKGEEDASMLMWFVVILPMFMVNLYLIVRTNTSLDDRNADEEISTTGLTEALYMYTQEM